ncbi:MAG: hypothetical protein LBB94_03860 [Clostridiales bacterium]|nr:hypothetical protein [Clostridiales bacterium]
MDLKETLEKYLEIKREIKLIEQRLDKLQCQKGQIVSDTVTGCTPERSDKHVIKITGIDMSQLRIIENNYQVLARRRKRLRAMETEIESFIDSVEDSKVRQIITLRYLDGLTWKAVGRKVYGYSGEDAPRKYFERWFARSSASAGEKCPPRPF